MASVNERQRWLPKKHAGRAEGGGRVGLVPKQAKSASFYRLTHNKITRSMAKKITMMISSHSIRFSFTSAWTTL